MLRPRTVAVAVVLCAFAAVPIIAATFAQPHYLTVFGRILIFAIGAVSLNLVLGHGGLVSFGHAAFIGIGAYAVGILDTYGIDNGWIQWPLGIIGAGLASLIIGAISVRLSGIYFIMITLAFAQLLYFLASGLTAFGGDDGMTLAARSFFGSLLNLNNQVVMYYVILLVLLLFLLFEQRFVTSRLGIVIAGIRSNEVRMRALGYATYRYKLIAFVISAMMCSVSGLLLANLTDFVTAQYLTWGRSGELLIMVLLGGMASTFGPVIGATALLLFEEVASTFTEHWQLALGPLLLLVVIFAQDGIWGWLGGREKRRTG
jgi:branched-chain amino acid transport system permease protein